MPNWNSQLAALASADVDKAHELVCSGDLDAAREALRYASEALQALLGSSEDPALLEEIVRIAEDREIRRQSGVGKMKYFDPDQYDPA